MPELLRFNSHVFSVDTTRIKSFRDLKVKTTVDTEEMEDTGSRYIRKKTAGSTEVDFTAILSAFTGNDVRSESLNLIKAAQDAETGYLYLADGGKVWPFRLMVTETEISESIIGAGGRWTYAAVRVTMKQCEMNGGGTTANAKPLNSSDSDDDGGSSSGGSGGGGGGGGGGSSSGNSKKKKTAKKVSGKLISIAKIAAAGSKTSVVKKWTTPAKDSLKKPANAVKSTGGGKVKKMAK